MAAAIITGLADADAFVRGQADAAADDFQQFIGPLASFDGAEGRGRRAPMSICCPLPPDGETLPEGSEGLSDWAMRGNDVCKMHARFIHQRASVNTADSRSAALTWISFVFAIRISRS